MQFVRRITPRERGTVPQDIGTLHARAGFELPGPDDTAAGLVPEFRAAQGTVRIVGRGDPFVDAGGVEAVAAGCDCEVGGVSVLFVFFVADGQGWVVS